MGAAASMKLVYTEALQWFRQYFDDMTYASDFHMLDKNGDGGVTFDELRKWLHEKATKDSSWKIVVSNPSVFRAAHMFAKAETETAAAAGEASGLPPGILQAMAQKEIIFGLDNFKHFLMHLFVLSILFVHFKHADSWKEGEDMGNDRLTLNEFKLACRSFMSSQANEDISDEKVKADFEMLDLDKSGTLDFLEVCTYCSRFVDPDFASKFLTQTTAASAHASFIFTPEDQSSTKSAKHIVVDGKPIVKGGNDGALDAVARELAKSETIAEREEVKASTEVILGMF